MGKTLFRFLFNRVSKRCLGGEVGSRTHLVSYDTTTPARFFAYMFFSTFNDLTSIKSSKNLSINYFLG
jgi:hypothetical protein